MYHVYMYYYTMQRSKSVTGYVDNTCVPSLDVMLPMKLMLNVNCCRGAYGVSGDFMLETPYKYIFFVGMDDPKM